MVYQYALDLVTAPAAQPLSVDEAKSHLRVDHTTDDTLIESLIKAATQIAERFQNRRYINQTWRLTMDRFPDDGCAIEIPIGPLSSVTSITYTDSDGAAQTWGTSNYQVDTRSVQGRIVPDPDTVYPTTEYNKLNAVTVTFVVGYGASSASVPENIRHAIRMIIGDLYNHRESTITGTIVAQIPRSAEMLLWQDRINHF
jgi:uncharacterized phiE125 gp8 family phage protein